jgi:hypothetical protein
MGTKECDTMKIELAICLTIALFACTAAGKDNLERKYVGLSGCAPMFKQASGTYSIRLDKHQKARLAAHTLDEKNVLTIVQYQDNNDQCGIVRDAVQSDKPSEFFEFECTDQSKPSVVVVGTRPENDPNVSGRAVQAWRVDLNTLRFAADDREVTCVRRSYAGNDDEEDLATWARKRVEKH